MIMVLLPKQYIRNSAFCQVFMKNPGGKKIPRIFFGVILKPKVVFGLAKFIAWDSFPSFSH